MEEELYQELKTILVDQERSDEEITSVRDAYLYAYDKHEGQFRKNQEKYIIHPVHVAIILAQVPVDTATVISALLHDVLEDTDATAEDLKTRFGDEVLSIVEGVTKLGKFQFESKEERNAENFRKMFLAMASDVRVILLKLCDRLHNMRTLEFLRPEKQQKIARETLEVFAPLANRMGMGKWRAELEDLSFKYLSPEEYQSLIVEIEDNKEQWTGFIDEMEETLTQSLKDMNIEAKIYGRIKNYFSVYSKMRSQQKPLQDVYDLMALRIIVPTEKECYEALGMVHSNYKPMPGRFKDYIGIPKRNLYQSLHTTVIGPEGRPMEVQIRTEEMHRIAEYGVAAHWRYKESGNSVSADSEAEQKLSWLKQMLEMKEDSDDPQEYVDNVKLDLFRDEVFVFTPNGDVFDLPQGSVPIDFAFRIHTEVGYTCTGAMVNGKIVPLDYVLQNGDILEIITSKKASPRLDWIKLCQTQQAKNRIRQWFKKHFRDDHIHQGKQMLEDELGKANLDEAYKEGKVDEAAQKLNYTSVDDMLMALGYGELSLPRVANRLKKEEKPTDLVTKINNANLYQRRKPSSRDQIEGLEGMLYHLAKCCSPLPGDPIVGVVTRSRGVMVHRDDCVNLGHVREERMMEIFWRHEGEEEKTKRIYHSVRLDVHVIDRIGIFKDILARIADINTNLSNARVRMLNDNTAIIELTVDIADLEHLDKVKHAVKKLSDVISVSRAQIRPARKKELSE